MGLALVWGFLGVDQVFTKKFKVFVCRTRTCVRSV